MIHPFLTMRGRQQAAAQYAQEKKIGFVRAWRAVRQLDDDTVSACCLQADAETSNTMPQAAYVDGHFQSGMVGAFGDGSIIQAIIAWLKSPEGQAFISALIKLLLAALIAA